MPGRLTRKVLWLLFLLPFLPVSLSEPARSVRRDDPDAGKVVIYRDEYGVPHIFAPTIEGGLYAMGYAQAEDRLEELLKNYLRGTGEMSASFGPSEYLVDLQSRLWRHYEVAKAKFARIRPEVRRHMDAFVRGINDYMDAHRSEVPAWWGNRKVDVYMIVAHSRQFMWGWPTGQALAELRDAGISPNLSVDMRSSNEMVIAPSRTSVKAPILIIDPHLSWWGAQRFWEFRIHAGELNGSGFTLPGSPYVGLGHNDHVAWAMTTGGPDTADIYVLELNPANPLQYKYDGSWRDLVPRRTSIAVKGESLPRELTFYDSHNGPVVARRDHHAYVAKLSYADEVQFAEAFFCFNTARSVEDLRKGLDLNQLMPQNIMAADSHGEIYYQRTGRVPIRPAAYDFSKPVDGSTSRTEWLGIHNARDLISVQNPPQGYMQNCNVAPDVMMVGSTLRPDGIKPYMFNEPPGRTHQRGARAVDILQTSNFVSPEEAIAIALDDYCFQYDRWTAALGLADNRFGTELKADADYQTGLREILSWDGHSRADSRGALKFYYWRRTVKASAETSYTDMVEKQMDYMAALAKPKKEVAPLTEPEMRLLVTSLSLAMKTMRSEFGTLDRTYGDVFRVGRGDKSWPVGGGSLVQEGMATIRAVGFEQPRADHTRWGSSGQTSTQVVVLTRPVQSWTQPPIGQSDRPDSAHYCDQAERLFSKGVMKPTWYQKKDLLNHVSSRIELNFVMQPSAP